MTVIRRIFVEGFGTGKTDVVDARCSTDLAKHQFDMSGSGAQALEHVKDAIRQVHAAMPDMTFVIEDSVEDGDTIWVRDRDPGYGQGPLLRPTRGRTVEITWWTSPGRWGVPERVCPRPRPEASTAWHPRRDAFLSEGILHEGPDRRGRDRRPDSRVLADCGRGTRRRWSNARLSCAAAAIWSTSGAPGSTWLSGWASFPSCGAVATCSPRRGRSIAMAAHRLAQTRRRSWGQTQRYVSIARSDLAAVIYDALDGRVELILGDTVQSLADDGDRVRVRFESGRAREFDLVVGADGLHSRVRRLVFGPDEQFEKYLGIVVVGVRGAGLPPARRADRHDVCRSRLPGGPALAPRRRHAVPVHCSTRRAGAHR